MFVLNPDPYLLPSYRISPFTTHDIEFNIDLQADTYIDEYFKDRFTGRSIHYTINGREALNLALSHYKLQRDDIVTILTTSGNFYISSCVTREIEKFCRWSRKIENDTKIILVNHEFGYPYDSLGELKETGIPVIEDCAHSFFSYNEDNTAGNTGDFVIYSFPKMFPVQIGGLLLAQSSIDFCTSGSIDGKALNYLKKVLSYHIKNKESIIEKRLFNYYHLKKRFAESGFDERFQIVKGTVPGVFMFRTGKHCIDLPKLKRHFYSHGIQCSVFYGEEVFFIPVHQALSIHDLEYFHEVMLSFINTKNYEIC